MSVPEKVDLKIAERITDECKARMAAAPGAFGCIVLLTAQGNLYSQVDMSLEESVGSEEQLLDQLSQKGDTQVTYLYCYPYGAPSWRMVKLLPELDPRNWEAGVMARFLEGGYGSQPLRKYQPPKK